jgi:hypothetical protein
VAYQHPVEVIGTFKVDLADAPPESEPSIQTSDSDPELDALAQEIGLPRSAIEAMKNRFVGAPRSSVFMIELLVRPRGETFDQSAFRQVDPCAPTSGWQVPHQLTALSTNGEDVLGDLPTLLRLHPELLHRELRLAFFIHFLDPDRPLETPFGEVALAPVLPLPYRLKAIQYTPFEPSVA